MSEEQWKEEWNRVAFLFWRELRKVINEGKLDTKKDEALGILKKLEDEMDA